MSSLDRNENFINFVYLSANFYNYVTCSGKNFKKAISIQEEKKNKQENEKKNNEIFDTKNEFQLLNNENYMDYLENLSFINNNDSKSDKRKIELIKLALGKDFMEKDNEVKFFDLTQKINFSMLCDKFQLVEFISVDTINFLFHIYEYFFKIIKNMEEYKNKEIQELTQNNLLSEEKLEISKKKLLEEIINLKNKIEIQKQVIINNKKEQEKLKEKNSTLENNIKILKKDIKDIRSELFDSEKELKENIKILEKKSEKISLLETELRESKEKISLLEDKILFLKNELEKKKKE